jgi:hypothetical protein
MEEQAGQEICSVVWQLMVLEDRRWGWRGTIEWFPSLRTCTFRSF